MSALSVIADLLSIVGFAMTLWTLLLVRNLNRRAALIHRGPALLNSIKAIQAEIAQLVQGGEAEWRYGFSRIGEAKTLIARAGEKLGKADQTEIKRYLTQLDGLVTAKNFRPEPLYEAHDLIAQVSAMLDDVLATEPILR